MLVDLRTHRVLEAQYRTSDDGGSQFPIEIAYLRCSKELNGLVGTVENPGTRNGVVSPFKTWTLMNRFICKANMLLHYNY